MPVQTGKSVLTGNSGSISFKPAATDLGLADYSDFPAGTDITVPLGHGFRIGDKVKFAEVDSGHIDSALTVNTDYFVKAKTASTITISATDGGAAITLAGDGGTGSANTQGYVRVFLSDFTAVANVASFELSLERDQIETTSLSTGANASDGLAQFKTYQAGFIEGTGSMEVQFTADQGTMASRLLDSSLKTEQSGAEVKLYINTIAASGGGTDDAASAYIEAPITILGFSFSVSPEEVTTATLNFALSGQPTTFKL